MSNSFSLEKVFLGALERKGGDNWGSSSSRESSTPPLATGKWMVGIKREKEWKPIITKKEKERRVIFRLCGKKVRYFARMREKTASPSSRGGEREGIQSLSKGEKIDIYAKRQRERDYVEAWFFIKKKRQK